MIVFSAFCPHAPVLIPTIGKENLDKLESTVSAYKALEQYFYLSRPDTAVIISPHGLFYEDAFSINFCDKYKADFEDFGDYGTNMEFSGDYILISAVQDYMRDHHVRVTMDTCDRLDHGTTVPLFYLAEHKPKIKLVPITYSKQGLKTHFQFGQSLKEVLQESNKRVAVIASGDLSHRLSTESPAGFSKYGAVLDGAVKDAIINKNAPALMNIDQQVLKEAGECGLKSLLILMGILHGIKYDPVIMDYNDALGVGYLTCNFQLS